MLKRINWKLILHCFLWVISLGGIITLMSFIEVKKDVLKCKDLKVLLPGNNNFIEREEVDQILFGETGTIVGRDLDEINIHRLENLLKANPFVEYDKVYADMDGIIHVDIRQRKPVLRVINRANVHFYLDENGLKMPMSDNYTAHVLVANGLIDEDFSGQVDSMETPLVKDLFTLARHIKKDTLWNDQIEQVYVNLKGDIELVPRVGDHKIVLGDAQSLDTKFRNLLIFYKKAMPGLGWDAYKSINLKFANQIVCEKNKIDSIKTKVLPVIAPMVAGLQAEQDSTKN